MSIKDLVRSDIQLIARFDETLEIVICSEVLIEIVLNGLIRPHNIGGRTIQVTDNLTLLFLEHDSFPGNHQLGVIYRSMPFSISDRNGHFHAHHPFLVISSTEISQRRCRCSTTLSSTSDQIIPHSSEAISTNRVKPRVQEVLSSKQLHFTFLQSNVLLLDFGAKR